MSMEEDHVGIITAVSGRYCTVTFTRSEMCAHCGACETTANHEMELKVQNTCGAVPGDRVRLELPTGKVAKASLWAYAMPLCLLLVGVAAGSLVSDVFGLILGLVLCAGSFLILHLLNGKWGKNHLYEPRMVIISHQED